MSTQGSWGKPLDICATALGFRYPQISPFAAKKEKIRSILVEYTPGNLSTAPTTVIILDLAAYYTSGKLQFCSTRIH